ncbi:MAG: hypothetical protein M3X11_22120, partial [Acidobacteriota bacterium]|nr:hypothetical protein [Acidobacteriota bacterium]
SGLIWLIAVAFTGKFSFLPTALLTGTFLLGATTGWTRAMVAAQLLFTDRARLQKHWWGYVLLGPLVSLLYVYNVFASAWTTRIVWRGIGYEMNSPRETTIWHRPELPPYPDTTTRTPRQRKASVRSSSSKP